MRVRSRMSGNSGKKPADEFTYNCSLFHGTSPKAARRSNPSVGCADLGFLQSTGCFVAPWLEGHRQLRPGGDPELWKDPV
jgi:hypothetical protein